jgi:predicted O-methyltransferase YrrM
MNESENYFVSSRGLMKSCDFYSKTPMSSSNYLTNYTESEFKNLKNIKNPKIYVCSKALEDFCNRLLPVIDFHFILISGDCDETMPYDVFTPIKFHQFINNKYLLHWFCQNMTITHSKITNMPIGMDYHTMTKSTVWGAITTTINQEKILQSVKEESPKERQIKCYANFQFLMTTRYGSDRQNAINQISADLVYYEQTHVPRLETWKKQCDYAFVISPHGGGFDCHRTWEALVLGCIPIVRASKIDILYEDLPVLIVKEWSDVTKELLKTTVEQFKTKNFNLDKLSLKYWTDKMQNTTESFEGVKYRLADNWFNHVNLADYTNKPIKYLEIGAFYGANVLSVADTYGLNSESKLYCVDPWEDYQDYPEYKTQQTSIYTRFVSNITKSGNKDKIVVHRGYSNLEVPKFEDDFFDIIYIDGNHEPEYVLEDAVLSFRKLKKGGIMIFDDYGWGGPDLTKRGIDGFLNGYHKKITILGERESQVFIKKKD